MTSLKNYNSFGIDAMGKELHTLASKNELIQFLKTAPKDFLFLGGGSNVLLTHSEYACVAVNAIKGIRVLEESDQEVTIAVGGGENWHEFVLYTLNQGWYGLENLALIPGTVGAAPIQNIGAYGKEVKDYITSVQAIKASDLTEHTFNKTACNFDYRHSFFKENKNQYYIYEVCFTLQKNSSDINISYGIIEEQLKINGISNPTPMDVAEAVIAIRSSKLPDPKKIGNSGSFFKNPVVSEDVVERIKLGYENFPLYPFKDQYKLAAAWLIDQCGWKGKIIDGRYGVHDKQALVLVRHKEVTGAEIYKLSEAIIHSVHEKFGVQLEREVNIY